MRARRSEVIWDVDVSASSELWVETGNKRMWLDEESRFGRKRKRGQRRRVVWSGVLCTKRWGRGVMHETKAIDWRKGRMQSA